MIAGMKVALCNEVLGSMPFAEQCAFAAALGYDGLEVAPFTLGPEPHLLPAAERRELRIVADAYGLAITGLHWLLVTPEGLSVTSPDDAVRARTRDVIERLVGLCADLGGTVLVHGSPKQRALGEGARDRAVEIFRAAGNAAKAAGVTYCLEPLARNETDFVNTVEEAVALIDEAGSAGLATMVDTSAAGQTEVMPVPALLDRWLPTGRIAHIQLNDTNRRAPGQGTDDFAAIVAALQRNRYRGIAAVEPFIYHPDGPSTAARAIGYLHGLAESSR
jgi:D-psicose/D-tagatose/L-ribulose 3-epimerase